MAVPGAILDSRADDPWAEGLAEAHRTWGPFPLPLDRFVARAEALLARRLERAGTAPTPFARAATLRQTARADLAVAVACEERISGAWEVLHARLLPRLRGLARKRGMAAADAETLASDVLSELAMPPGGASGARTVLGTFDGTGSLFGWSAVILVRRLSRLARPSSEPPPEGAERSDPAEILGDAETADRFDAALRRAWARLAWRERLALAYRFLDGRPQVEIARLLRLSPPRVSRIVNGAVAKLRDGLRSAGLEEPLERRLRVALADAVRKRLAPTSASAPLPDRPGPRPEAREP
jgi:RNA polymerase sigma factor (sigma-70 family)